MTRVGMSSITLPGIIFLGLFFLGNSAHAEIFKWVDANGKVHYSDRKMNSQAQQINIETGAATLGQDSNVVEQRLMHQKKYVNYLQSERLERQEKRLEAQQAADKKKKLCAALQDQLHNYNHGSYRWYELDEASGERSYLSDDQIESKKEELQAEIASNC